MKDQLELLIEFTKDQDARSRATAIAGLAKIADPRGFAPVLVALFDPVDEVRITAATALGVFKDERAVEPLVSCVNDQCEQVAVNSVWALGQLPGSKAARHLIDVTNDEAAALPVRTAAVTAIGECASSPQSAFLSDQELCDAARLALLDLASHQDDELRATVIWALGHLPHSGKAFDVFVTALQDSYEWAVRYAIEALANTHDAQAIEPLQALASDGRKEVSQLAKKAIEQLG